MSVSAGAGKPKPYAMPVHGRCDARAFGHGLPADGFAAIVSPMSPGSVRRNVAILTVCQGLGMTAVTLMLTVSALTGEWLAPDKSLATLPLSLQFLATMLATVPASLLMRRIGRRAGFTFGAAFGLASGAISLGAAAAGSFWLFCVGNALLGVAMGFALFYRFAAAEAVDPAFRAKAISWVLSGGVAAAIIGPELAKWSRDLTAATFAGCFAATAVLFAISMLLLQWLHMPRPGAAELRAAGRPLARIARQPVFVVAALGGMVGYAVMALVMTAAPLAMIGHRHGFEDAAFVIQWHAIAMFAPSFVTGHLIRRFEVLNVLLTGAALIAGCIGVGLSGAGVLEYWLALVLLGLGWNFLYIGATALLTEAYRPAETAKVQALNDFLIFSLVALSSFSSGVLQDEFGWRMVNLVAIPPILAAFLATIWLKVHRRRRVAIEHGGAGIA